MPKLCTRWKSTGSPSGTLGRSFWILF